MNSIKYKGPEGQEDMPYLLTPGPLTTARDVKLAMLADWGSRDIEFRDLISSIRSSLLEMAGAVDDYECVLMQGAGTFSIEAALSAFSPKGRKYKTLVLINGAYGKRAAKILDMMGRVNVPLEFDEEKPLDPVDLHKALMEDENISSVFWVHCETTTGIINPVRELAEICQAQNKTVILDAMSSFGALPLNMSIDGVDVLVSSANKCIEGVPGFGYVLARRDLLEASKGKSASLSLDLYDQWQAMEKTRQFRFTPPTHTLVAFHTALQLHMRQGGVAARFERYQRNRNNLLKGMRRLGFETLLDDKISGPIIQTFLSPDDSNYDFEVFYNKLRSRGFAIYPGKLTKRDSFRVGTIGNLNDAVFRQFLKDVAEVLQEMKINLT